MATARYISGVGCNASLTILALLPLYRRGLVRETVIEVKVGSSEGGNKASPPSHHPERAGVVRSYKPKGHRHVAEPVGQENRDLHDTAYCPLPAARCPLPAARF